MADASTKRTPLPSRTLLQNILGDRLLMSAFVVCALLFVYQLCVILLQPPWIKPATDWLRTALAWPQLLVVAWVAVLLLRSHRSGRAAASWGALGLLSYAIARTSWTIADAVIYPHGVPFPSLPDLFFILQYPCYFMAVVLQPERDGWLPSVRVMLDGLLWMSAITALSWYFVLWPIFRETSEPAVSKTISMFYQIGDLMLFYAIVVNLARPQRTATRRLIATILCLAAASLFVADTWAAVLLLQPPHTYRTGSAPDLFWFSCYLLVPLAALVQLRLAPAELPAHPLERAARLTWREMAGAITFVAPSFVVVGTSAVIILNATLTSRSRSDLMLPELVGIALLLLATLRPAVLYVEQERVRRERDAARAQESALRLANERMETFLSMAAHELRTPLTSLMGNIQLMARRLETLLRLVRNGEDYTDAASMLRALIGWCDQSAQRIARLVEDVLDEARVKQGRLALRLEVSELVSVVGRAVAEQMRLNPDRHICCIAEASSVPVLADAGRIEQVVTNYVSNALKFSRADQMVEVCVQTTPDREARVSVHDEGVGVPLAEQPRIWEHLYQAPGVDVKSGSQVGFGIGLYVSKAIVEGHHGQVGVESAPGRGTTFWFTLPLAASRASLVSEAGASSPAPASPSSPASTSMTTSEGASNDTDDS